MPIENYSSFVEGEGRGGGGYSWIVCKRGEELKWGENNDEFTA
jgi:hypothetical protein